MGENVLKQFYNAFGEKIMTNFCICFTVWWESQGIYLLYSVVGVPRDSDNRVDRQERYLLSTDQTKKKSKILIKAKYWNMAFIVKCSTSCSRFSSH
jgi:hypothetical protein